MIVWISVSDSVIGVIGEDGHGVGHLADHIGEAAIGMKRKVARARSRGHLGERRIVGRECSFVGVELVDQDLVEPEVRREGIAVGPIKVDRVAMGVALPAPVDALPFMLNERRRGPQRSIGLDRQAGNTAAAVIRHQDVFPRLIHGQMARAAADRRLLVQELQRPLPASIASALTPPPFLPWKLSSSFTAYRNLRLG